MPQRCSDCKSGLNKPKDNDALNNSLRGGKTLSTAEARPCAVHRSWERSALIFLCVVFESKELSLFE
jgi:hypothetical protein